MPKGHPRCPDCHGAGGKQVRRVGHSPRWVRCKCVPSGRIDANTKAQALNRLTEDFLHNHQDKTRLTLALDVLYFFQVPMEDITTHLRHALPYDTYMDREVDSTLLAYTQSKEDGSAD